MQNNQRRFLSNNIKFVGDNIYLITTALAIYISAKQHLTGEQRNAPLAIGDILNIAVVPLSSLFALWAAACRVYENIPEQFQGTWQLPDLDTKKPEVKKLEVFSIRQINDVRNILLETAIVQTTLTLALVLAIMYSQNKLSGNSRFAIDTVFYVLGTADYGLNLKALESIEAISKSRLQPSTLHPALRITLPTNSAIETRANRLAFAPTPAPQRRMSVAERLGAALFRRPSSPELQTDAPEESHNEDEKSDNNSISNIAYSLLSPELREDVFDQDSNEYVESSDSNSVPSRSDFRSISSSENYNCTSSSRSKLSSSVSLEPQTNSKPLHRGSLFAVAYRAAAARHKQSQLENDLSQDNLQKHNALRSGSPTSPGK